MDNYLTLSEAVNGMQQQGYTYNFNIQENVLRCNEKGIELKPDDFEIDKVFRFEGATDPGDESILYAISSPTFDVKGLLVNAYGAYSDPVSEKIMSKLTIHR